MPKTSLMPPSDLSDKVSRKLKVALRTFEPDVTEVRSQQRQFHFQIRVLLVPQKEPVNGKCSTEIVKTRTPGGSFLRYAGRPEYLLKRRRQCGIGESFSLRAGEESSVAGANPQMLLHKTATLAQSLSHVGSDRHKP
jgi:hypothetical protein